MRAASEDAEVSPTQQTWARVAGISFLTAIFLAIVAGGLLAHIAGDGTFTETAARIAASELLYRLALTGMATVTLSSLVLAFALYATLKPVNSLLALLGMIFCLADSVLALVVRMCGFVRLQLYLAAHHDASASGEPYSSLLRTIAAATENLGGICFGIGSCLFFFLFFKSKYVPRVLSLLGIAASVIWTSLYFANLVFPEHHALFQLICFPPMILAEVATGLYLAFLGVGRRSNQIAGADRSAE